MAHIYNDVTELIGSTPLMYLNHFAPGLKLAAKLERQNPAGSAKDRVALNMIRTAEADGSLAPGGMIIEPTSGNTGIGIAALAAVLGYRAVIVMPDSMSIERVKLTEAYGAEVVLTPGAQGMAGAVAKAEELHAANPGSIIAGQFENPANPEAHYKTTGPEIWEQSGGDVDVFVAGVGTGGTITGVGRYLKEHNKNVKIVAVEPARSPMLSKGYSGTHGLQGIGAGFVPKALDTTVYDEVITVTEEEAYVAGRLLGTTEGLLAGISSGAALHAATQLSKRAELWGKTIVVLLPDTGDRYLSTAMFADNR